MTCREKLKIEHPDFVNERFKAGCRRCPHTYGYLSKPERCNIGDPDFGCIDCWNREIPEQDASNIECAVSESSPTINDSVSHPSHYTYGKIECIDFIFDKDLDFALGNAIKYIVRAGHKSSVGMSDEEKTIQDLEKAKQYIDFEIEHIKGER